jgi:hypothetical protein
MSRDQVRQAALDLITALAPQGHSVGYIAVALQRAKIPTLSGRGTWQRSSVHRLAHEAGIKVGMAY